MVPFEDQDFHFVATPWLRLRFGQTNYRTYVIDRGSGQRAVWFFGTTLDSLSNLVPRHVWKLPWHRGQIRFDCQYDAQAGRYSHYRLTTPRGWAPVELELEDTGRPISSLNGCDDLEAALVALTHPMIGVYYRRDGELGTYRIWHDRLKCTVGKVVRARIDLFDRLGIASYDEQNQPHSVLIQHRTEFFIRIPPGRYPMD
jgi:hypothetical protein